MAESTLTSKGQTTVPLEIRDALGAKSGTKLLWHVLPDGSITVRAKSNSIANLAGILKAPKGKHVTLEEMNAWR